MAWQWSNVNAKAHSNLIHTNYLSMQINHEINQCKIDKHWNMSRACVSSLVSISVFSAFIVSLSVCLVDKLRINRNAMSNHVTFDFNTCDAERRKCPAMHLRARELERVLNIQRKSNHLIGNESIVFLRHLTASMSHLNVKISPMHS